MTAKPMTPREDVEFWLTQSMRFMREDGCVPVTVQDKLINLLRALLAERDAALVVIAKYRDALQSCGCKECVATIEKTPDA